MRVGKTRMKRKKRNAMKKILSPPTKSERGQSLLELAISLMVLLMLLTGSVEFGLALFQFVTIRDAAQEGAVFGSINPTKTDEIRWRTMDAASDVVTLSADDIDVTVNGSGPCEGHVGSVPNSIEVVVGFDHPITYPFVAEMTGTDTIRLTGRATTTILLPVCP